MLQQIARFPRKGRADMLEAGVISPVDLIVHSGSVRLVESERARGQITAAKGTRENEEEGRRGKGEGGSDGEGQVRRTDGAEKGSFCQLQNLAPCALCLPFLPSFFRGLGRDSVSPPLLH